MKTPSASWARGPRISLLVLTLAFARQTLAQAPSITTPPLSKTVTAGQAVSFVVSASGAAPLSYQWKRNGQPIGGATDATLAIGTAAMNDAGYYEVAVANGAGSAKSVVCLGVSPPRSVVAGWGNNYNGEAAAPAGLHDVGAISSGFGFSVAMKLDGTVVAWGYNTFGETNVPFDATSIVAVSAGGRHTVALRENGTVKLWGTNSEKQLVPPLGLSHVVAISAGGAHTLALKADGTVAAWGLNSAGQCAIPTGLADVVAVDAGDSHSLALRANGTVVAWGDNTSDASTVPPGLSNVRAIFAGGRQSLALRHDGTVVAWGANASALPVGLSNVVGMVCANQTALALKSDGSIVTWGSNSWGQRSIPAGLGAPWMLACGEQHVLAAISATGPVISGLPSSLIGNVGQEVELSATVTGSGPLSVQWFKNDAPIANGSGITGATTSTLRMAAATAATGGVYRLTATGPGGTASSNPVTITMVAPPVITGKPHALLLAPGLPAVLGVVASDPTALTYVWRRNGQVVSGATGTTLSIPSVALSDRGFYEITVTNVAGGSVSSFFTIGISPAVSVNATVRAWGEQTTVPAGLGTVSAISAGPHINLALKSTGEVVSWGQYSNPQTSTALPAGLSGVISIAAATFHHLALKSDGTVVAWGPTTSAATAVPADLRRVVAIAAGYSHSVALRADGTVVAWGDPFYSAVPANATDVIAIAASSIHTLGLKSDGTVIAWGSTFGGQTSVPAGLNSVVAIAAGDGHSLALKADGTVVGWGDGAAATPPAGLNGVVAISARSRRSMALRNDGSIVIWGDPVTGVHAVPAGLNNAVAVAAGDLHALALIPPVAPEITTPPAAQSVATGADVTFSVAVTGTAPLTYQWTKDSAPIPGATSGTLTISGAQPSDAGNYAVIVANAGGSITSTPVSLAVSGPPSAPVIRAQTQSFGVLAGSPVELEVKAAGSIPLSYQWYAGAAGDTSAPVAAAMAATLSLPAPVDSRTYWCRVTNSAGFRDTAVIRVLPWVARDAGAGGAQLAGASFAQGRYFVFGNETGFVSPDGVSWGPNGGGFALRTGGRAVYGKGVFVSGGGSTGATIYVSTDAKNWTSRSSAQPFVIARVIFTGTRFVAICESGGVSSSEDGQTWTSRVTSSLLQDAAFGGGLLVAVGYSGTIMTSTDGLAWTSQTAPTVRPFVRVAYGNGRFVAFTLGSGSVNPEMWTSTNGSTWVVGTVPSHPTLGSITDIGDITFGGGCFVATSRGHLLLSEDGLAWSVTPSFFDKQANWPTSLAYGHGRFLFAGERGVVMQTLPVAGSPTVSTVAGAGYVLSGQTVTLSATASGPSLSYQWYRGTSGDVSQPIAGATAASYVTPPLTQRQNYWVRVSNALEQVAASTITVDVAVAPAIVSTSSRDLEVRAGQTVVLSAEITGSPAPQIQWYEGEPGDTTRPVVGGVGSTLTVTAATSVKKFWVRATNMAGAVNSVGLRYVPWTTDVAMPYLSVVRQVGTTLVGLNADDVYTSEDGRVWTKTGTAFQAYFRDIAHGAGLYVAVGDRGFYSSPDLVTWTKRNLPFYPDTNGASSVARGNDVFVAVGRETHVSANGIDWTPVALPAGMQLASVAFDGTRFVGAGISSTGSGDSIGVVATSVDGVDWTRRTASAPGLLEKVAYVGGKYIAINSAENFAVISSDAITWTRHDFGFGMMAGRICSIAYAFGRYLIGAGTQRYFTSPDAVSWTVTDGPAGMVASTFVLKSSELLAFGTDRSAFASSDTWTWQPRSDMPRAFHSVTHGAGRYLAVALDGTYASDDGMSWSFESSAIRSYGAQRVAFGLNRFVGVSDSNGSLLTSPTGRNWSPVSALKGISFGGVIAAGNRLFATSASQLATTGDGTNWSIQNNPFNDTVFQVAYGNNIYVAAGAALAWSSNGTTWTTALSLPSNSYAFGLTFGNGVFLAVGRGAGSALILTSTDGQTWTPRTAPPGGSEFHSVAFVGGRFVVGTSSGLAYSSDAVTWQVAPQVLADTATMTVANGRPLSVPGIWRRALDGLTTAITELSAPSEVAGGATAQLRVGAVGPGLSFQWFRGSSGNVSNPMAAGASAVVTTPPLSTSESFWVRVTGAAGTADSATVRVRVAGPPTIVAQPSSAELYEDSYGVVPASLRALGDASGGVTYQWFTGARGNILNPVIGANGPVLVVSASASAVRYWVRIGNAHGSVDSVEALVTPWDRTLLSSSSATAYATAGMAVQADRFVVTGLRLQPSPTTGLVLVSSDALNWGPVPAPQLGAVVFGNGRLVAASHAPSNHVFSSNNEGGSWSQIAFDSSLRVTDVFFAAGRFFAVTQNSAVATSTDGLAWSMQSLGSARIYAVAGGGGHWLAVGAGGTVLRSANGITWNPVSSPTTSTIRSVAYGAAGFLMVADSGSVFSSSDGQSWQTVLAQSGEEMLTLPIFRRLVYEHGRFFGSAEDTHGSSLVSSDGSSWWQGPPIIGVARTADTYVGLYQTAYSSVTGSGSVTTGATSGGAVFRSRREQAYAQITVPPVGQSVEVGQTVTLSVTAVSVTPVSYQWRRNGLDLPNATGATLGLPNIQLQDTGNYQVIVANAAGRVGSDVAVITVLGPPQGIMAASARLNPTATELVTGAFTIESGAAKRMLVRAVGPTLAGFGTADFLPDPRLNIVMGGSGVAVAANDDWGSATNAADIAAATAAAGAFPLASGSKDAAVLADFEPGTYRVSVFGLAGANGVVSLEIFDAGTAPRLVYVAVLGSVGEGRAVTQGITVLAPPPGRSYLIRALGPALGSSTALADPRLALFVGETQVAANDNWGGTGPLITRAQSVGAMPLPIESKDAALNFVPSGPGAFTVQVAGAAGMSGKVLLEIFEADEFRAASIPVAFVSLPANVAGTAGQSATFGVVAVGKPAPTFQWSKNGSPISGAVGSTLVIPSAQVGDAGTYSVRVSNGGASTYTASATLAVAGANNATHGLIGRGYVAGSVVTLTTTLHFVGAPASLNWSIDVPAGWSFASDTSTANSKPSAGAAGTLAWAWTTPLASPLTFTYTLNVPAGETAARSLTPTFLVGGVAALVAPATLTVGPKPPLHSADTDGDSALSLFELTRVIELYNTRNGTVRTGAYRVDVTNLEDGFSADSTRVTTPAAAFVQYHSADTRGATTGSPRDGMIDLFELTRVIELYNTRAGTVRTGRYHVQDGTEDGFAAGP